MIEPKRAAVARLRGMTAHALTRQVKGKEKGATHMEMNERKEFIVKNIAEKFVEMDDADKSYIAGYMAGKQEERQKWEQRKEQIATA